MQSTSGSSSRGPKRSDVSPDSGASGSRPADPREARAFAIIVYHALRSDLARLEEDDQLDELRARAMILRAVNLFPGYEARENAERGHLILIEKTDDAGNTVSLNIQDAVDSLLIVWRDFQKLRGRDTQDGDTGHTPQKEPSL